MLCVLPELLERGELELVEVKQLQNASVMLAIALLHRFLEEHCEA